MRSSMLLLREPSGLSKRQPSKRMRHHQMIQRHEVRTLRIGLRLNCRA
jgi:hypothetical protein